jgi:hypothetical protein
MDDHTSTPGGQRPHGGPAGLHEEAESIAVCRFDWVMDPIDALFEALASLGHHHHHDGPSGAGAAAGGGDGHGRTPAGSAARHATTHH